MSIDLDKIQEMWEKDSKIDPDNLKHQEALYHFLDDYLKIALELSLNYFQEQEEYEKCVHLKKNLDFVNHVKR